MDNEHEQTGYNTEMHRVERLARMEVQTTETYSTWQKKLKVLLK